MIRVVLPPLPDGGGHATAGKALFRAVVRMMKAEAWQTAAVLHGFAFDPSSMPDPPNSFTTVAGALARALHTRWSGCAEPVPRTMTCDGATETTWPNRSGVPIFLIEAVEEQRRVYLADSGFITAVFPRRRVEVARYGRYTTGRLGGRTGRAAADALAAEPFDSAAAIAPWPPTSANATPYSVLARTLLAVAATALEADAPELLPTMRAIGFDDLVRDGEMNLTVAAVHAF